MSVSSKAPMAIRNHGAATSCISTRPDGGIALSCLLTSASVHDSQAAIPLATMTAARVTNLYDLMDSAYDAPEIRAHSASLGHVAVIDANPRSAARKRQLAAEAKAQRSLGQASCEQVRYRERSTVERVNGSSQGRLWRSSGTCARSRQGAVPPEVRHSCADGGAVGTATGLKPIWFHPAVAGAALSRRGCTGEVWLSQTKGPHRRWIVTEVKYHRRPDGVSEPKNSQLSKSVSFALDVELEFCKWLEL